MIYTVTFNPALDYAVYLDQFVAGEVNRTQHESLACGGKGVNVSIVLHNLGMETVALGFLAGFTGRVIQAWMDDMGVPCDFVLLEQGMSRINVKIKYQGETEINGQGPHVTLQDLSALYGRLDAIGAGDTLVLAGSIPASLPSDIYEQILARLQGREIRCVVDATGPLLEHVLQYHPFLIKPNHTELGELCGCTLEPEDTARITTCARQLQQRGARNVLVSMAGAGALLLTEDGQQLQQAAAKGIPRNSVGAGDSMVAGFLAGLARGGWQEALRLGTAAGGATAFSPDLATGPAIEAIFNTLLLKG